MVKKLLNKIKMKNKYSSPKCIEFTLTSEPLMNVVSGELGNAGAGNGTVGNNTPDLANRRRGEWGNLW